MVEPVVSFTLKVVGQCLCTHYTLIRNFSEESEMLFRDFKRLACVLEEAHDKKVNSSRVDLLVVVLSDVAIKLHALRKLILPQLQGSEKWKNVYDCMCKAKEVRKLRGELDDIIDIVIKLGIPNALNQAYGIPNVPQHRAGIEVVEEIPKDQLEARRSFCVELKKLIEDDLSKLLANSPKPSASNQMSCFKNPFKAKKPEVPTNNEPFSWSTVEEAEVYYTPPSDWNKKVRFAENPDRISGEEIVPRLKQGDIVAEETFSYIQT